MNVGTALRSGVGVLTARTASVLPVYLVVAGLTATSRVPVVLGLAAVLGILAADGRLERLFEVVEQVDFEAIDGSMDDPNGEFDPEAIPQGFETAVTDIFSPEIVAIGVGTVVLAVGVSIIANGLGNAAALNGVYGCLYGGDGVADAVVGIGRDWKPFVGLSILQFGLVLVGLVPLGLGITLFAVSPVAGTAATAVGGLLSLAIILSGLLALAFAGQSVVVDGAGFGTAVRRSVGYPVREPTAYLAFVVVALGVFGSLSVFGGLFATFGISQLSGIIGPLVAIPFLDAFKTALYADRPLEAANPDGRIAPIADAEADSGRASNAGTEVTDGGQPTDDRDESDVEVTAAESRTAETDGDDDEGSTDTDVGADAEATDREAAEDDGTAEDREAAGDEAATEDDGPTYRQQVVAAFRDGLAATGGFVRHHPIPILVAAVLFGLATAGGWQLTSGIALDLPAGSEPGEVFGTVPIDVFVMIAANNWLVSATAIYGGIALGIPTALDMLLNGFIVGALAGVIEPLTFAALVAPHGVIELPAIIVAGGLGFHLAATVGGVLRGTTTSATLAERLRVAYRVLLGLAVVLVIASFVEAFLTPRIAEFVLT